MRKSIALFALAMAGAASARDGEDLARKARAVLENHCYACHGRNGAAEGGMSFVLERARLVAGRKPKIIPGDADKSRLFVAARDREMPPDTGKGEKNERARLADSEIGVLREWIAAGAPDFNPARAPRQFISDADVIESIRRDLLGLRESDRPFRRYFTLAHLYNAGLSDDELQTYRNGLSKLLNHLSWARAISVPQPVDAARTVLAIDLRHYKLDDGIWNRILRDYPYGTIQAGPAAAFCYEAAQCLPHVRADWFVFAASQPPLYHDVLQLPASETELEKQLRVDADGNIRAGRAVRAGFNGSGVSQNNRLIERHASPHGAYWKSYDFALSAGRKNLFAHPLGPGGRDNHFQHDGGEIIFSLPNGLQGYLLVNARGERIDSGPLNAVSDPRRADRTVVNGISCMSCHVDGMREAGDAVRKNVEANPNAFDKDDRAAILALYPPAAEFGELLAQDRRRFQAALRKTGDQLSRTEPIAMLAARFEAELDLPLAAAEAGLQPEQLQLVLARDEQLARKLGALNTEGGTVKRDAFVEAFEMLMTAAGLRVRHNLATGTVQYVAP